jgi:hypothetical protein
MKNILLLIATTLTLSTTAQTSVYHPFPDSNAIWSEEEIDGMGPCVPCKYQFRMAGDTIINSIQYHKIYKENDSLLNSPNSIYFGGMREQSMKIYYKFPSCSNEIRLYDFTKSVGDTIQNLFTEFDLCNPEAICDTIISIDSILIGSNYRKVFNLGGANTKWIEGIGSTYGLLNEVEAVPTCSCSWYLVCFQQNDSVKYLNPNFSTCFPTITGIPNYIVKNYVNIFPNPVADNLTIETQANATIEIINIQGQTIIQQIVQQGKTDIGISGLAKGVYILRLCSNDKTDFTRIVKE